MKVNRNSRNLRACDVFKLLTNFVSESEFWMVNFVISFCQMRRSFTKVRVKNSGNFSWLLSLRGGGGLECHERFFQICFCLKGESQYSPPQDCPLGGQSWGGEYWYPGISTLPTLVITLFFCLICLYHASRILQTQSLISFFIFGTSWTLSKTWQFLPTLSYHHNFH